MPAGEIQSSQGPSHLEMKKVKSEPTKEVKSEVIDIADDDVEDLEVSALLTSSVHTG